MRWRFDYNSNFFIEAFFSGESRKPEAFVGNLNALDWQFGGEKLSAGEN
jgi:hypothetical protein